MPDSKLFDIANRMDSLSERRIKALMSNNVGIWEWDIKQNILTWDDMMFEIYKVDRKDFQNSYSDWFNALVDEDKETTQKALKLAVEDPRYKYFYRFRIKRDGEVRWITGVGHVFRNYDGEATHVVGLNILEPKNKIPETELTCQV